MLNQKIAALILPLDLFDALGKTLCQQPSGLIKLLYPDANSKNSFHHNTLVIGHLPTNSVSISLVVQVHYFIRVNAISYNYLQDIMIDLILFGDRRWRIAPLDLTPRCRFDVIRFGNVVLVVIL